MEFEGISSQDKLDQMLLDGKVTKEHYLRLSNALRKQSAQGSAALETGVHSRLCKSSHNRWVSGVCAGLAKYFGVDTVLVRVSMLVLVFMAFPLVVIAYFFLAAALPWDDSDAAYPPLSEGVPWRFIGYGTFLLTILPWAFSQLLFPFVIEVYRDFDFALPMPTRIAIEAATLYRLEAGLGHMPWGIIVSLLGVAVASLIYLTIHNRKTRELYCRTFFMLATLWVAFIALGSLSGFWTLYLSL